MDNKRKLSFKDKVKRRIPLFLFLALSTTIFFFGSALLLDESYKDIILIAMIWALPLFIH